MLGFDELKKEIKTFESEVECPCKGCEHKVPRAKRSDSLTNERFQCPEHKIFITPTTFIYPSEKDNVLWDYDQLQEIKKTKRESRIAWNNSEDAVTWNVFRFLEKHELLADFLTNATGLPATAPEAIYWSYSNLQKDAWDSLLQARVEFGEAADLQEARKKGSEPDLIVKSAGSLFFIESKLTATNETTPSKPEVEKGYIEGGKGWWSQVFKSDFSSVAIEESKYELTRFWLMGTWIAHNLGIGFCLLNLVREGQESDIETLFKGHIKENAGRSFKRLTWEDIYRFVLENDKIQAKEKEPLLGYFQNRTVGYKGDTLQKTFSIQ